MSTEVRNRRGEAASQAGLDLVAALGKATHLCDTPARLILQVGVALRQHLGCRRVSLWRPDADVDEWALETASSGPFVALPASLPRPSTLGGEIARGADGSWLVPLEASGGAGAVLLLTPPLGGWTPAPSRALLEAVASFTALALAHWESRQALEHEARRDSLTGFGNRAGFAWTLTTELRRADARAGALSALLVDLDGFGASIDRGGLADGQETLMRAASPIRQALAAGDYPARFGSGQFAILLPGTAQGPAMAVAQRLRAALQEVPGPGGRPLRASIGVALVTRDEPVEALVRRLEAAMQSARRAGGDRWSLGAAELPEYMDTTRELDQLELLTVRALVEAVDVKDAYTRHHSRRVGAIAAAAGRELGLSESAVRHVRLAGALHDVGKLGIPISLLAKTGPLTGDEWGQLRAHAEAGERLLRGVGLPIAARWVRHHHERWDGTGYPDGVEGSRIPLPSRLILTADAFDAMVTDRAYRAGVAPDRALARLADCAGTQFDPQCVAAVTRALAADPALSAEEGFRGGVI